MRPWINKEVLKAVKIKNRVYKKLCKKKFQDISLHNHYKDLRNTLTRTKKAAKKNYYHNLLQSSKGNIKKTWENINKITRRKKKPLNIPTEIDRKGKTIKDPQEVLNSLNTHFAEIGQAFNSENVKFDKIAQNLGESSLKSFLWENVTEKEISDIISNLNPNKATGWDDISIRLIQKLKHILAPVLCHLINQAFHQGTYPDFLKISKIIPVHKGGNKSNPSNYRPISLLSNINKIFEKIIYSRLYKFLETNKVIHQNQFGFRAGYSTAMAISTFQESLLNAFDKKKGTCAILLDLSKAFDTINRDIILYKLRWYGIRGNMWALIKSYLENREQFVKGDNRNSDRVCVNVGVPQGSVLGPLLFLIHINDIKAATNFHTINFADDTLLYMSFNSDESTDFIENIINKELNNIDKWLIENHLKLNTTKTKYMLFAPETLAWKTRRKIRIRIGQSTDIEQVDSYTYLGITIDTKLSWKPHIDKLRSKLLQALGILYRTRPYLDRKSLILLLHSLFMSHLKYGIICWGRATSKLPPLQILINKAMRCIYFRGPRENTDDLQKENKILRIEDMVKFEIGKFMFNYYNNLLPPTFNKYFINLSDAHHHNTRLAANNFRRPSKRTNYGLKTLSYLGVTTWEEIPDNCKTNNSIYSFSKKYKNLLLE